MFRWLGSQLDSHLAFSEYILMALSYRLIRNMEATIKEEEELFWNLGKNLPGEGWEIISNKIRVWDMPSRLLEYIPEEAVSRELLWSFHKIKTCGGVCILKMVSIYSFTDALNSCFNFSKIFSNQTKEVNESISLKY